MERRVHDLAVTTREGFICIEQPDIEETSMVTMTAEQVPLLMQWLEEAVVELNEEKQKENV
jgi:hypothetical protein